MIILLDLNYTLVGNSHEKRAPFARQIEGEQYRSWLVDLVRPHHVILITARPDHYRSQTLASIERKTRWTPQEACFNHLRTPPPVFKEWALVHLVFPAHEGGPYLGIESNPRTRSMYARHGIPAYPVPGDGQPWTKLPA